MTYTRIVYSRHRVVRPCYNIIIVVINKLLTKLIQQTDKQKAMTALNKNPPQKLNKIYHF